MESAKARFKNNTKWNGITKQTIKQRNTEFIEWDMNLNPVFWYATTKDGVIFPIDEQRHFLPAEKKTP